MTKKQAERLKPGDIIIEKATGDHFTFLKLVEVSTITQNNGRFELTNRRKQILAQLIPGFEYSRRVYTNGPGFYFDPRKITVKDNL